MKMFDCHDYDFTNLKNVECSKTLGDLNVEDPYYEDIAGPVIFSESCLGGPTSSSPVFVLEDPDDGQKSLGRPIFGGFWILQTSIRAGLGGGVRYEIVHRDNIEDMRARRLRKDEIQ